MLITLIRTTILYIFVTIGIRLMGKRQIGDMQPNELVITLLISEIAAIPLQDTTQPIVNGIVAIFALVIIEILLSALSMKSRLVRKTLSGQSIIIIKNGVIDQKAMKKVRLTLIDLVELLRAQKVFDISQVAYAILEVNGSLSVLIKNAERTPTKQELNIKINPDAIHMPVIVDGKVITDSLSANGISKSEFYEILNRRNINPNEIFLMMLDGVGNYHIINRESES